MLNDIFFCKMILKEAMMSSPCAPIEIISQALARERKKRAFRLLKLQDEQVLQNPHYLN